MKCNTIKIKFGQLEKVKVERIQWDKGQILKLLDVEDGSEVQFVTSDGTINKITNNNSVEIPDAILESQGIHEVYVVIVKSDSTTTVKKVLIDVKPKQKPSDYVSPDDEPSFREEVQQYMNETKAIAQSVRNDADNGKFDGEDGADGFSPVVETTTIEGGHKVSITDAEGTKSFDVLDGKAGEITPEQIEEITEEVKEKIDLAPLEAEVAEQGDAIEDLYAKHNANSKAIADNASAIETNTASIATNTAAIAEVVENKLEQYVYTYSRTKHEIHNPDGSKATYASVKANCEDAKYFVYLKYANRLYIPQHIDNSAVIFETCYDTTEDSTAHSIILGTNDYCTETNSTLQEKLTAGTGITIDGNNVISAIGGGNVDDVKVNGTSVVENKVADITVPTKTSELTNDSDFATKSELPVIPDTFDSSKVTYYDGTVKATLDDVGEKLATKQEKLVAGTGITIAEDGKTISAQGGSGDGHQIIERQSLEYTTPQQYADNYLSKVVVEPMTITLASTFAAGGGIDIDGPMLPDVPTPSIQINGTCQTFVKSNMQCRQVFYPQEEGTIYTRYAINNSTWSEWLAIGEGGGSDIDVNVLSTFGAKIATITVDGEAHDLYGASPLGNVYVVTTAPSSYSTTTGGFKPSYRISLSTAKTQSGASEIKVGDLIVYSSYRYGVGYVDSSYVYLTARASFTGSAGAQGPVGPAGNHLAIAYNSGAIYSLPSNYWASYTDRVICEYVGEVYDSTLGNADLIIQTFSESSYNKATQIAYDTRSDKMWTRHSSDTSGFSWSQWKALGGGGGSSVTVTPTLTSGTQIATITVDGSTKTLYAPNGGGGGSTNAIIVGENTTFNPMSINVATLESGTFNITTGAVAGTTTLTFVGDQHIQTLQQVCGTAINGYNMLCFNYVGCIQNTVHCFRSCVMQQDGRITALLTLIIDANGQIMGGNSQPVM